MRKNIIFIGVSVCLLVLLGIGFSYSMWNMSVSQDTSNVIATTSECFNIELTNQSNAINLENAYPISNEKGKKLTPFTFTVKNTCDMFLSYTVSLESLKGSTLNSKFIDVMVNNEAVTRLSEYETTETVNNESVEARILAKGSLSKDDSNDYSLRLWIDYDTTMEDLDNETKVLKAKVVIKAVPSNWDPVSEGYTTLHDAILANEYQTTPAKAVEKIKAKGTPDFSETAPIVTWQEKVGENVEVISYRPHPSIIGKSEYGAGNLTSTAIKILLGQSYSFDSTTGNYSLTNTLVDDPTTLDYSKSKYYYCYGGTNVNSNGSVAVFDSDSCTTLYQVNGATKSTSGSSNSNMYRIAYTLNSTLLTQTEIVSDKSDKGMYQAEDDYGTTYYYRGNVLNNNVYFAGMYWQIIRINGDGSIRLLYNGSSTDTNNYIGRSNFNDNRYNPAYEGYMYGKQTDTRENMIRNEVDSTIKTLLDTWYKNNFLNNTYNSLIADAGFCNSRELVSGDGETTSSTSWYRTNDYDVNFKCSNSNDLFTLKNATIGNMALTYAIGLPTYDELVAAGLSPTTINRLSYAYSDNDYWTMTPSYYDGSAGIPKQWNFYVDGKLDEDFRSGNFTIRPVISLKSDVKISSGIGTSNSPFVVETK